MRPTLLFMLALCAQFNLFVQEILAQPNLACPTSTGIIYGEPFETERGYSLSAAGGGNYYVAGFKDGNLLLMEFTKAGALEWSRMIDVVPNVEDHAVSIITDSEGLIGISGMATNNPLSAQGGSAWVLRFDPVTKSVLWAREVKPNATGDRVHGLNENGPGGNYLLISNAVVGANDDVQITEIDRNTGALVTGISKNYNLEGAESIWELVRHQDALYGVGRYTDGAEFAGMRHVITKLDANTLDVIWTKLGHIAGDESARLYGFDLLIDQAFIYSGYYGDPAGTSTMNNQLYIQKTTLEGEIVWIKHYDFPMSTEWGYEMVKSGNGFVIFVVNRSSQGELYMFKIDADGHLLWSHEYDVDINVNTVTFNIGSSQMITTGDHLVFTATTDELGDQNILIVTTDLEGNTNASCVSTLPLNLVVNDVTNGEFYDVNTIETNAERINQVRVTVVQEVEVPLLPSCAEVDTLMGTVSVAICEGDSYETYSTSGTYEDLFVTNEGCDSIRILNLTVESCQPECEELSSNVFGEPFIDEHGRCIVASKFEPVVYIAGNRGNNTMLLKVDLNGNILWTRVLDIVDIDDEIPAGIVEDSDGTLVIVGTGVDYIKGGIVYACRYDPGADIILWANHYIHSPNDMAWGVIEKVPGGNYLFVLQPNFIAENYHEAEVVEIDRNTGEPIAALSKTYRIIGTESLFEITYHDGAIYGTGRYKDGGKIDDIRTTLVKLDGDDGDQQWVKMGHRITEHPARLYGDDLVIVDEAIYVFSHGDPDGQSITNTDVFIQKTDLNGNLTWLFEYELPGLADYTHDIIAADGGLIVLGVSLSNEQYYMFKIDSDGNVLWGQQYIISGVMGDVEWERGNPLLTQAGNHYFFTGFVRNAEGDKDLLIVSTDLEGNVSEDCLQSEPITIDRLFIENIAWYDRAVNQYEASRQVIGQQPQIDDIELVYSAVCSEVDTLFSELTITICQGQSFENYTESGIYQDTFVTAEGCDSIRMLTLTVTPPVEFLIRQEICSGESFMGFTQTGVYADTFSLTSGCDSIRTLRLTVLSCEPVAVYDLDACRSYMSDGSIMDYSEFDPEYPNGLDCGTVTATNLFRSPPAENKHSCTDGLNGTLAMCISALNSCTYQPGNNASAIMEITFTPDQDSTIAFNKLEFYEKAPVTYSWIDGPSGPNNYPRYYGIRILKNGTQVFEQHDIATSQTWALQTYTFNNLPEFKVTGTTTFRIELLPYCPIGNAAPVSAWDLEDIRLFASCAPEDNAGLVINGTAATWNATPVYKATIQLSATSSFESITPKETTSIGTYRFDDVRRYHQYHLKAAKNTNLLQGVNTRDIIDLQKHLLGKQTFKTLDQYIAGDINHTGTINAMDMIELRKAILGMQVEFTNNTSWRFAVKPVDMESRNMDDFIETAYIESLFEPTAIDWLGVKIGDVNRDAGQYLNGSPIITRSDNTFNLVAENIICKAGELMTIDFVAEEAISLEGFQLSMEMIYGEIVSVHQGSVPLNKEHYYIDANGKLRLSWSEANPVLIEAGDVVFSITVRVASTQLLTKLINVTSQLTPEAYGVDEVRPIALKLYDKSAPAEITLQQLSIVPNPFTDAFTVTFTLPHDGKVSINVFTTLGELVYMHESVYAAGNNHHTLTMRQLNGTQQMLFCQVAYAGTLCNMKVVKLE